MRLSFLALSALSACGISGSQLSETTFELSAARKNNLFCALQGRIFPLEGVPAADLHVTLNGRALAAEEDEDIILKGRGLVIRTLGVEVQTDQPEDLEFRMQQGQEETVVRVANPCLLDTLRFDAGARPGRFGGAAGRPGEAMTLVGDPRTVWGPTAVTLRGLRGQLSVDLVPDGNRLTFVVPDLPLAAVTSGVLATTSRAEPPAFALCSGVRQCALVESDTRFVVPFTFEPR